MFTSFNIKYPEYVVITPQTLQEFTVRSLTVQEEEWLKGSMLIASKISDHLNRCIWDCIVSKPKSIQTYEDFLNKVTLKDRDALVYGIHHVSYGDITNYTVACSKCGTEHNVSVKITDAFNVHPWPSKKSILDKVEVIKLPISGIEVELIQPTLQREQDIISKYAYANEDKLNEIVEKMVIKRLIKRGEIQKVKQPTPQTNTNANNNKTNTTNVKNTQRQQANLPPNNNVVTDQQQPTNVIKQDDIEVDNFDDILFAMSTLPAKDSKFINKMYQEKFGQYGVELKMAAVCPKCGFSDKINIDLITSFFRMVFEDSI